MFALTRAVKRVEHRVRPQQRAGATKASGRARTSSHGLDRPKPGTAGKNAFDSVCGIVTRRGAGSAAKTTAAKPSIKPVTAKKKTSRADSSAAVRAQQPKRARLSRALLCTYGLWSCPDFWLPK